MDFSDWIGNSVTSDDVITARMVDHFKTYAWRPLFYWQCGAARAALVFGPRSG